MFGFMLELQSTQQDGSMGDLFKDHQVHKASRVRLVFKVQPVQQVLKVLLVLVFLMPQWMEHLIQG
jgi:hypothetical protein